MPYLHLWERHGVVKRFTGFVSGTEFVESAQEIAADERFESLRFIINDFLSAEGHGIDASALENIAVIRFGSMLTNPNIRVLVVTTHTEFTVLAEAAKAPALDGSHEARAFPTMALAREWLAKQCVLNQILTRGP